MPVPSTLQCRYRIEPQMKLEELKPLHPTLDQVFLVDSNLLDYRRLDEGKLVSGRFPRNIRVDEPTHLAGDGQTHAHVFGRRGNELGVVNFDGTGSHGSKFKVPDKDADTLRKLGFDIPSDNLVEWRFCAHVEGLLLG